jgi:hypothetical protein
MAYLLGLAAFAAIVYGIVKAVRGGDYENMTAEEFEAEAKRSSYMAAAIMATQKIVDPNHHVEYVQEEKERVEADSAESGDRPDPKSDRPAYDIPR